MDQEPVPDAEQSGDTQFAWRAQLQAMRLLRRRAPVPERSSTDDLAEAMAAVGVPPFEHLVGVHLADVQDVERLADVIRRTREHEHDLAVRREDRAYVRSARRLALVLGWTAYILLVITFVATLIALLTDSDRLPVPLGGVIASGLLLFAWTWRSFLRTTAPRSNELRREPLGEQLTTRLRRRGADRPPPDARG